MKRKRLIFYQKIHQKAALKVSSACFTASEKIHVPIVHSSNDEETQNVKD